MIKKFTAPTMKDAVAQMKHELGADAVVLKTEKVKQGGLLDFTGGECVEITAVLDKGNKPISRPEKAYNQVSAPQSAQRNTAAVPRTSNKNSDMQLAMLKKEVNELRTGMAQVGSFLKYNNVPAYPENLQLIMKQLLDNEISHDIAKELIEEIHNEISGPQYDDLKLIVSMLLKKISSRLKVPSRKAGTSDRAKTVMLIGPTGVGKTTTIAKLATNQKLINNKKVALISADTFRIGAIDQLKTFANIADIPLTVAYTPDDIETAVRNYSDMDVIYIDTTGRSQNDIMRLKEMKRFVNKANPDEIHLVLNVTTSLKGLQDSMSKFSMFKYNRILFTKLDETISLGVMLNLLNSSKIPVSYLTNGQNVPEDIERATVNKLAKMIVRRKSN